MKPRASIIIRCYNEEQHIGKLLSGISQQSCQNHEIIIVDSGSTDATLAIAARYPVKIVSITPEEFSFGRSLNIGCKEAQSDFLVFVSAHVYPVHKDWLEQLLKPFNMPQVALVYGKQRGNEITKYSEHQIFSQWFPEESNYNQENPFCNNANAAVRKTLWQTFPYDEELTGLEDLSWSKNITELGYCIAYSAEAEIIHVHDESFKRIYNRYRREAIAFHHIFPQEHFNILDFLRLLITNIITDYIHAIYDKKIVHYLLEIPLFRLMQFWGTYKGFREKVQALTQLRKTFYYPRTLERPRKMAGKREAIDYSHINPQEVSTGELY